METQFKQAPLARSGWFSLTLALLREHPLSAFFVLALAFTWVWEIPLFGLTHQNLLGPWVLLSLTTADIVMAGVMKGRHGIVLLLRRLLIWRVGLIWYLVALLLQPTIWLVSWPSCRGPSRRGVWTK